MKKLPFTSDAAWRPIVFVLAILVVLQLIFSRHVYDVTIYTYRVMQSYYFQESPWDIDANSTSTNGSDFKNSSALAFMGIRFVLMNTSLIKTLTGRRTEKGAADESGRDVKERCKPELGATFAFNYSSPIDPMDIEPGGEWEPDSCVASKRVALIIPFRQRYPHLRKFLPYMHAFLQRQQLHYRIFVIEQADSGSFNRAKLMNVGFKEAMQNQNFDCYVFHDVDLLPLDERTGYNCSDKGPVHLAAAMDKFGFAMPYSGFFGGACMFTKEQLERINGFSNKFVGWGGEDDDIDARIRFSGQTAQRYPVTVARYHMIKHGPDKGNEANPERHRLLQQTRINWRTDGLNSLTYAVANVTEDVLFTKVSVDVS